MRTLEELERMASTTTSLRGWKWADDCEAELRRQHALIQEMREAVRKVLLHRHDTPTTGYLRDNDASRGALRELAAILAKSEPQS